MSTPSSSPPRILIHRRRERAQYFREALGDGTSLDMILIPGGSFMMGSPEDEPERENDEGPQHEVTVPQFFMGRYPITQSQWRFVAGLPQVGRELQPNPSQFEGDQRPVERVSWYEAVEFCDRLSIYTKRTYRLPSEAEWEYACRAGTQTPFYFGKTLTTELVNYDGNYTYNGGSEGEYREQTTPVDQFGIANAFGLCDMHGNVWEWCQDHWHDNYEGAPTDGSAWVTGDEGSNRTVRGGSWAGYPGYCRSATRYGDPPDLAYDLIGFRVICLAPRTL
jgi:formylglycine-generating enzyme required for sulfatase activity